MAFNDYQIEILTTSSNLIDSISKACDSLNKVQDSFRFELASKQSLKRLLVFKRAKYKSKESFQWLKEYRNEKKGNRPFIILIVDGFLSSEKWNNIFGTISRNEGLAIFTTHNFDQFVHDLVRFCRYYLVRYALSFVEPNIRSHSTGKNKDCIFHFKEDKREILLSLDSGNICDDCRGKLDPKLSDDSKEALAKMLSVVSNQYPYSLVLKGGGVKGLAFAGALIELEKHFSFNAFAGTSAGAIAAILLGAEYKPSELLQNLQKKNFSDFKDASSFGAIKNLIFKKGLYPGDSIQDWIDKLLKEKIDQQKEIELCHLPLHTTVYASRKKEGTMIFDSRGKRKETHASYAARCSMSIPLFFVPKRVDDVRVFDGGMKNNFPLKRFVEDNSKNPFIGLYLKSSEKTKGWILGDLLNIVTEGDEREVVDSNRERIVVIDTDPISTTDFNLNDDKKRLLVLAGRVAAMDYMSKYQDDISVDETNLNALKKKLKKLREKVLNS